VRRHWFSPKTKRWEYCDLPEDDERAEQFLSECAEAEEHLRVYRERRHEVGTGVEEAPMSVSQRAGDLAEGETTAEAKEEGER
jgi:hypothetical protein